VPISFEHGLENHISVTKHLRDSCLKSRLLFLETMMRPAMGTPLAMLLMFSVLPSLGQAQDDFENPPIEYSATEPHNRVSRLQEKLDKEEVKFTYDQEHGYLRSVLDALEIPVESQMLVFSKTSLQLRRISPKTPRAVYFADDVYLGFCQSGDVIELSAVDPQLGTVFYTLDQRQTDAVPKFERRVDNCLICHSSSRTNGIPGHLVRSLFVEKSGHPMLSAGSRSVNHTTPIEKRWGGWYVTGKHGTQKHLGNLILERNDHPSKADNSDGMNLTSLAKYFNTDRYLTGHSDIVALMVLEHQVLVQNRITNASFTTRQALSYNDTMNRALENEEGTRLDSTTRRIHSAGDKLVDALLFVDEAKIEDTIQSTSGYAEKFVEIGPKDKQGRSLRELDLTKRMFKYPCSYLIYSTAFEALPEEVHKYVWKRLGEVLSGEDTSEKFAHLTAEDRQAIVEILRDTMPSLPKTWGRKL